MKSKILLSILFVAIVITPLKLRSEFKIDSLKNTLKSLYGNNKADVLNKLAKEYRMMHPELAIEYANNALKISQQNYYKKGIAEAKLYMGAAYSYNIDPDLAKKILDSAIFLCREINNQEAIAFGLRYLGIVTANSGNYVESNNIYRQAIELGNKIDYKEGVAFCYNNLSVNYSMLGIKDSSVIAMQKALEIFNKIEYSHYVINSYIHIGRILKELGEIDKAAENYVNALSYAKTTDQHTEENAMSFQSIAYVYYGLGNYEKSLEYSRKAIEYYKKNEQDYSLAKFYSEVGKLFGFYLNKPDSSLIYHTKSLEIYNNIKYPIMQCEEMANIGAIYSKLKNNSLAFLYLDSALTLANKMSRNNMIAIIKHTIGFVYYINGDYKKALEYYQDALDIRLKYNLKQELAISYIDIANLYFKLNNFDEALIYFQSALTLTLDMKLPDDIRKIYRYISDVYLQLNDIESAFKYQTKFILLSDSLNSINNNKKISDLYLNFELAKKEAELDNVVKVKNIQLTLFISISILVFLFSIIVYRNYRKRKRTSIALQEKNEELEEINKRLSDSEYELQLLNTEKDNYLYQINSELVKAANYIKSLLPSKLDNDCLSSEGFYHPCEELGGDAYGYYQADDENFVFYLIDVCCHGIGPALHSVSILNFIKFQDPQIIDFTNPTQVLKALNKSFQMKNHNNMFFTMFYGVYNCKSKKLKYASAGHPPAILINNNKSEKLRNPNYAVGGLTFFDFKFAEIDIQSDSLLYIFSDGVYEVRDDSGIMWDLENLEKYLLNQHNKEGFTVQSIYNHVKSINGNQKLDDDFSVLEIRFK